MAEAIDRMLQGSGDVDVELANIDRLFRSLDPKLARDKMTADAVHLLRHWRDDEDIRSEDFTYAAGQRAGLEQWVARLRGGS